MHSNTYITNTYAYVQTCVHMCSKANEAQKRELHTNTTYIRIHTYIHTYIHTCRNAKTHKRGSCIQDGNSYACNL